MRNLTQPGQASWAKKLDKYTLALAIIITFGGLGIALLLTSHAATPTASIEAENGTASSAVSSVSDTTASGGRAIKFGTGSAGGGNACIGFPDASCTGVSTGSTLTNYTGSCSISGNNVVIDSKILNCDVRLSGTNLTIKNSKVTGQVTQVYPTTGSISVIDSEVNIGQAQVGAIVAVNLTVTGSNIYGGQQAIHCDENCTIKDSFLHGQYNPPGVTAHLGGFLSSGGAHIDIEHNTIQCDASPIGDGGCSGDLNLFGDFGQVDDVYIYNNLFPGINNDPSYCIYGGSSTAKTYPHATNTRFINNVIGRGPNGQCGSFGPVAGWESGNTGNQWTGNKWDDGTPLNE